MNQLSTSTRDKHEITKLIKSKLKELDSIYFTILRRTVEVLKVTSGDKNNVMRKYFCAIF